jgi:protease-4
MVNFHFIRRINMEVNLKKVGLGLLVLFLVGLLFLGLLGFLIINAFQGAEKAPAGNVAVINVTGTIMQGAGSDILGSAQANSTEIMRQINKAKDDEAIKALVLKVNSPGGSSAASDAIYQELKKFKQETNRPVVVSMGDMAASGGYYVSALADQIYANPATITGSIGVIMNFNNLEELYDKLGVENITLKTGEHKDIGSPTREMTEEEKEILNNLIGDVYDRFVNIVAQGRDLSEEKVRELADGRIYNGSQAKEANLVDEQGTFYDAVDTAAKLANIEGEPKLVHYGETSPLERLLGVVQKLSLGLFGSKLEEELATNLKGDREELFYYQLLNNQRARNLRLEY